MGRWRGPVAEKRAEILGERIFDDGLRVRFLASNAAIDGPRPGRPMNVIIEPGDIA